MGVTYLDPGSSQMGKKESIADTAKVLGRMYDGIEYRGFSQKIVEELAANAGVPVWNGLTDEFHPTQMLADLLTIEEKKGTLKGLKFTYFGDARNNMGNSLMIACAKMGLHFTACAPKELFPAQELVELAKQYAAESGGSVTLTEDITEGAAGADVLYTDIWVSMGEPDCVWAERIRLLKAYQVNAEKWRWQSRTQFSCTACPRSMTQTPPSAGKLPTSLVSPRWRSPTTCSWDHSRSSSMRRKTACTRSRRSCTQR